MDDRWPDGDQRRSVKSVDLEGPHGDDLQAAVRGWVAGPLRRLPQILLKSEGQRRVGSSSSQDVEVAARRALAGE